MQKSISRRDTFALAPHASAGVAAALFFAAFALYVRTLAPSVTFIFDDSLEMQYIVPRFGIPHPTGYPLYAILGKLFTLVVPLNDAAFRLNLFSAFCAALTIPVLYIVIYAITTHQLPAVLGAIFFAVSRTFWEQAVIAEVYALQMLLAALILYAGLRWGAEPSSRNFYWLAFAMGLGLTHHRLVVLLYPAIAIYGLWNTSLRGAQATKPSSWSPWGLLRPFGARDDVVRAALFFLLPLSLYLYLPWRGAVGSANGEYENTFLGFLTWASGAQYTVFLGQNPLNVQHDAAYYLSLFVSQFTLLGLALAAIGTVWLARKPRELALLGIALMAEAVFAFIYRTADVQVHFLTTFLLLAIFVGAGARAVLSAFSNLQSPTSNLQYIYRSLFTVLLLTIPTQLLVANYPLNDLSTKWDVHDYAIDVLAQPTEPNATLIGILGEMTLVRYFQSNLGLRPDIQTVPADKEADRLTELDAALNQNRAVYLTRPLKGATEKYSLESLGPLIRVKSQINSQQSTIANPLNEDWGAVRLLGYAVDASRLSATQGWHAANGRVVRITVHWQADEKPGFDALVSIKLLSKDRRVAGQLDQHPVRDAYPTNAWRAGEIIADTYEVPIFLGAPPGEYAVNVTLYDSGSGAVFGSADLQTIELAPDLVAPRREAWQIARTIDADFGAFALAGYTLDPDTAVQPGNALPLTLLWRASQPKTLAPHLLGSAGVGEGLKARVWLEDGDGKSVASRDAAIGLGFPASQWQPGQFVRESPTIRVPANVADGKYRVKLAVVRGNELLGGVPFRPSVADLGFVEIKNRARVIAPPALIPYLFETTFDQKIRLLGYNLGMDSTRQVRLTLYWKALALMDTPYTVFVHVLDPQGKLLVAADAAPEFPTTGWMVNEYVIGVHTVAMPAETTREGTYRIEVGWYDPSSGARLKTADGQDRVILGTVPLR